MRLLRRFAVPLWTVACLAAVAGLLWVPHATIQTEDHNGDGRPDVWRTYDGEGRLAEVQVDTNFDGRSDVHEYYEHGTLVRRESDRHFTSRVDLIEEFDPATFEHIRSVVDVDADGVADLLVLFSDGRPVFTRWSRPNASTTPRQVATVAARRTSGDVPAPLADPFEGDLRLRPTHLTNDPGACAGLSTSGGLPSGSQGDAQPLACPAAHDALSSATPPSPVLDPRSPRGPPAPALFL